MLWRDRSKAVADKHINFILRKTALKRLSIAGFNFKQAMQKSPDEE
jgi:hypothetical protein